MKILHELSWLWETLGIALVAAAVCMACAALIGKAAKKKLSKKLLAVIGAAAFVGAILAVILIARTPMPWHWSYPVLPYPGSAWRIRPLPSS